MARIEEALALLEETGSGPGRRQEIPGEHLAENLREGLVRDDPGGGPSRSAGGRSAAMRRWQGKVDNRDGSDAGRPPSTRVVGRRFEHLVRDALLAHPGEWGDRFDTVWLWDDWPDRWGPDVGIDLVARQTGQYGGGLAAIQCKYRTTGQIRTAEIESFLSASGTADFTARLLVTNGPGIQASGQQKMQRAEPRCEVLHAKDMDDWVPDWTEFVDRRLLHGDIRFERHELRPYQKEALRAIRRGFENGDRGKLILPCGTGKSFIALRAAEQAVGTGGTVLYLVPSIALMGQTMREWSRQRDRSLRHWYLAVCSDATAGRRETSGNTALAGDLSELVMPVTTDAESLAEALSEPLPQATMRVVFSTYHSTPVVAAALAGMDPTAPAAGSAALEAEDRHAATGKLDGACASRRRFDLIVADEAHRTTGLSEASATAAEKRRLTRSRYHGISPFNLVHHDDHLPSRRRLYMTATPRVFTSKQRRDLEKGGKYDDADSYSMDDPEVYGEEFHRMSFAEAIDGGWLSDYQVLVIARSTQDYETAAGPGGILLPDGKALDAESAVKLGGCWDALATPESDGTFAGRRTGEVRAEWGAPARSAIAFCGTIPTSKKVASAWEGVAEWHRKRNRSGRFLDIEVDHLDARTPAVERASLIAGLRRHAAGDGAEGERTAAEPTTCRVLSNVRVLSEGVDVPALDAVVFLESRSSPIDVTQAVGRVMRRAPGKEIGYIVIPVVVDQFGGGTPAERAERLLREGNFKPVWDVVRALRAHDERIDYWLNARRTDRVRLLSNGIVDDRSGADEPEPQLEILFDFGDSFASLLLARCGDRGLYASWGRRAALVCRQVEQRVKRLVEHHPVIAEAFRRFHENLRQLIGQQQITRDAAAEMLAQHVVTIPIFDHVVTAEGFAAENPLARAYGLLLEVFREHGHSFEEELRPLTRAYRSMERAFRGAASGAERLNVLKEIYESFFKAAIPAAVKSLGIVYTPVEIVDFMLRSVDAVCRDQFGKGLTAQGVHVLDPFTGTGTFLNRLLTAKDADGEYLVRAGDLERKYGRSEVGAPGEMHAGLRATAGRGTSGSRKERGELHANEIVLLAYYIAALKIEEARFERIAELQETGSNGVGLNEVESRGGLDAIEEKLIQKRHGDPRRTERETTAGSTSVADSTAGSGTGAEGGAAAAAARSAAVWSYEPFGGVVLTDTFLMSEKQAAFQYDWRGFVEAGRRISEQNSRPIRVIVGNPPWSAGRKAAGDESVEVEYREVAERVSATYVRELKALGSRAGVKAAGNLFVKAFRWASDRLEGDDGIVCFVHPNSLADAPSLAGMRKALRDEFTDIHVVNLRGNAYKSGAERRDEGDPMFGQGTRNGVQITVLVRNQAGRGSGPATLHYVEVPDRMSLDRKFRWLEELGHVLAPGRFQDIPVNDRHDWVNLGDPTWNALLPVCRSSIAGADLGSVSHEDALGLATNLDAYVYSFSFLDLCERVEKLIAAFNEALGRWQEAGNPKKGTAAFDRITGNDSLGAIKWTGRLKTTLLKGEPLEFDVHRIREVLYRPFTKLWLYEDYRILSAGRAVSRMFPRATDSSLSLSLSLSDRDRLFQPDPAAPVRNRRRRRTSRPLRHGTPDPSDAAIQAVLISGTNMLFEALASRTLPDLATIKGSQQTRCIPRGIRTT